VIPASQPDDPVTATQKTGQGPRFHLSGQVVTSDLFDLFVRPLGDSQELTQALRPGDGGLPSFGGSFVFTPHHRPTESPVHRKSSSTWAAA
jgi:hypothetical protein